MYRRSQSAIGNREQLRAFIPYFLASGAGIAFLLFARLDYDRIHDGFMLAQAMGVDSGLRLHSDVSAVYGPVTPWIQSAFLSLPVSPAFALRLQAVTAMCGTVFLLADMGRLKARRSPITFPAGMLAAITWIAVSDVWLGGPVRPWSSVLVTFLVVLAAHLALRAWYRAEQGQVVKAHITFAMAGAALGLTLFTRMSSGLIILMALLACSFGLFWLSRAGRIVGLTAMAGYALSLATVLAVLAATNSLGSFFGDTVLWPLSYFSGDPGSLGRFLWEILPIYGIPVGFGVLTIWIIRAATPARGYDWRRSLIALTGGLLMLVALLVFTRQKVDGAEVVTYWTSWRALIFFYVCSFTAVIGIVAYTLGRWATGRQRDVKTFAWLVLSTSSMATLLTIVPTFNGRHLWWSLPLGLVTLYCVVEKVTKSSRFLQNPLALPLAAFAAYAAIVSASNLNVTRFEAPKDSVAAGMLVSREVAMSLAEDRQLLERSLMGRNAVFLTVTGDLSVLRGVYSATDPFFTCWGPLPDLEIRLHDRPPVVLDTTTEECGSIESVAALTELGYVLKDENSRLFVYDAK